jgi:hypothetical protein
VGLTLDFRFVEIEYELWALGEYLNALEQQLPAIAEAKRTQTYTRLQAEKLGWDDPETEFAFQELYEIAENVLPRFLRGPFLATLWALYESAVTEIASYLRQQQKKALGLRDIRGGFLDRAQKYFDHILAFPLCTDDRTWERLKMLMMLRNALAHANGRLEAVNEKSQKKIEEYTKMGVGVAVKNGNLLFTEAFVRETYVLVRESLISLIERVHSAY